MYADKSPPSLPQLLLSSQHSPSRFLIQSSNLATGQGRHRWYVRAQPHPRHTTLTSPIDAWNRRRAPLCSLTARPRKSLPPRACFCPSPLTTAVLGEPLRTGAPRTPRIRRRADGAGPLRNGTPTYPCRELTPGDVNPRATPSQAPSNSVTSSAAPRASSPPKTLHTEGKRTGTSERAATPGSSGT